MKTIALIPAKSTSQRIKDKNIVELAGKPLMAYSIAAALESGVFDDVYVVCRDPRYKAIAESYDAKVFERGEYTERTNSRDYAWVFEIMQRLHLEYRRYNMFSILRPTSPFRTADTIRRAFNEFDEYMDSLRAVEPVSQTPYKMWWAQDNALHPLLMQSAEPEHSSQSQHLPRVYVQNASLEMAWTDTLWRTKTIAGAKVQPFYTQGWEGFDINVPWDLVKARYLIKHGHARLPEVPNG